MDASSQNKKMYKSRCSLCTLTYFLFSVTVLAILGAVGLTLVLWFLGPGVLGEMEILQNERQLVSRALQFCSRVGARSEEEFSGVAATLFLTNNVQQQDIVDQCNVPDDGENYCYLNTPIVPGYLVFIQTTNSSQSVAMSFNDTIEFSFVCEHRVWLYAAIAIAAAVCVLVCGCCLVGCCTRLCRTKRKEESNLFIYTPLIDHSQDQDNREHSLIVSSVTSSMSNKNQQNAKTLQLEESSSYRYSTFKPGTKVCETSVSQADMKGSKVPNKPKKTSSKLRTVSTNTITFDTFKSK